MDYATRHILLRDRRDWLGALAGLDVDRDGLLTLAQVPGPADGKAIEVAAVYPCPREVSGIAPGPCDAVFVSDTAHDRVLYADGLCAGQAWLEGLSQPRGLAFTPDALLVADSGHGRVQHFALPALEANLAWGPLAQPTSIAVDSKGRVLAIDATAKRLHRVHGDGSADAAFDAAIVASGKLAAPLFVAVGRDDRALVSDGTANEAYVFDAQGAFLIALATPAGCLPGALATHGARIYVADAASGSILVFTDDGALQGNLPGYRGPVTAMAVGANGDLYVKPALDASYFVLRSGQAYVGQGTLASGPLDAGELRDWECARLEGVVPPGTLCVVEAAQMRETLPGPVATDWYALPSQDVLLAAIIAPDPLAPPAEAGDRRYLWLRITLTTTDPKATPSLAQVHAATPAENYLDHLPFTFRFNDVPKDGKGSIANKEGFLSRLLKLVRGEWSGIEQSIDDMPRVADPQFVDATDLPWLAQWLALELPQIASDEERRDLIARAVSLFTRRGTPGSIAEFVALHTGIRPAIIESFEDRHVWMLGRSSRLDFDTQLPPLDPNGMIVPDLDAEDSCCPDGLVASTGATANHCPCDPGAGTTDAKACVPGPIGQAVVGESGPLTAYQVGLPLFSEGAYRFCVFVDAYRVQHEGTLEEIRRIVDREKPAHTDYRIELIEPDLRIGLQARVGIDAIVGGDPPAWRVAATLGFTSRLSPRDSAARVGETTLGKTPLTLT